MHLFYWSHEQGINIDSYQILDQPDRKWVELVSGRGLALFTWGSRNNSRESVDRQRSMGVDGVIYDRWVWLQGVTLWVKGVCV